MTRADRAFEMHAQDWERLWDLVIFLLVYNLLNSHILPSTIPAAVTLSGSPSHTLFFFLFCLDAFLTIVLAAESSCR